MYPNEIGISVEDHQIAQTVIIFFEPNSQYEVFGKSLNGDG